MIDPTQKPFWFYEPDGSSFWSVNIWKEGFHMESVRMRIESFFRELGEAEGPPFYSSPIPSFADERICGFIDTFLSAAPAERKAIMSALQKEQSGWFFIFAERMAALGVRERSYTRLLHGLIGLVIEGGRFDLRENIVRLALFYHSAVKIGLDPKSLFREAASYENNIVAREISAFPARQPKDRSLKAMGYEEVDQGGGFEYRSIYG